MKKYVLIATVAIACLTAFSFARREAVNIHR